ncbi:hypothetical protein EDD17DRAFT_1503107 [Pisolithus thermaeus]|nr:hypothetical protein EV401DRAFT_1889519 [Pisolithus croceorrhizus]KAI6169192.1 hypothetical protein EDD17DRAFT_1503107 [Pisolithus thermaeus]
MNTAKCIHHVMMGTLECPMWFYLSCEHTKPAKSQALIDPTSYCHAHEHSATPESNFSVLSMPTIKHLFPTLANIDYPSIRSPPPPLCIIEIYSCVPPPAPTLDPPFTPSASPISPPVSTLDQPSPPASTLDKPHENPPPPHFLPVYTFDQLFLPAPNTNQPHL